MKKRTGIIVGSVLFILTAFVAYNIGYNDVTEHSVLMVVDGQYTDDVSDPSFSLAFIGGSEDVGSGRDGTLNEETGLRNFWLDFTPGDHRVTQIPLTQDVHDKFAEMGRGTLVLVNYKKRSPAVWQWFASETRFDYQVTIIEDVADYFWPGK